MIKLPSTETIAAILAGILLGLCVLFFNLWKGEVKAFADYRGEVVAAGKAQEAETLRVIDEQKQITEDTTDAWKAALDHTRNYYADRERLRKPAGSGSMPGLSSAASGVDGACENSIPSARSLEEACAETTLTLNYLQYWVESQMAAQ